MCLPFSLRANDSIQHIRKIYISVSGHAGFAKGSTFVTDNSNQVLFPKKAAASTEFKATVSYSHFEQWLLGVSYHTGTTRLQFDDIDIAKKTNDLVQIRVLENLKYQGLSIDYRKYFSKDENLKFFVAASLLYQFNLKRDTDYFISTSVPGRDVLLAPTYHSGNIYLNPEIGLAYYMDHYGLAELGVGYRVGFGDVLKGSYTYTGTSTGINMYRSAGVYPYIFLKYGIPVYEIEKRKPKVPKLTRKNNVVFGEDNIPTEIDGRKVVKQGDVRVKTKTVVFHIWDSGFDDGDSVSLNINGEWILEKFAISQAKKELKVTLLADQNNYLILYALNLGKKPPNTVAVSYMDGKREVRLNLKSTLKESGAINFYYEEEE
jgi:hypothetical protein